MALALIPFGAYAARRILLIRGRVELDVVDGIPEKYLAMNGSYTMTPEQRVAWEAEVRSLYDGRRLLVEVSDDGGPARLRRRIHDVGPPKGHGLELAQTLASRWGVRESSAGRTIWFEVDLAGGEGRAQKTS